MTGIGFGIFQVGRLPVPGILSNKKAKKADEAKLLYVAMTRSADKLLITSHKENELFNELSAIEKPPLERA